MSKNTMSLEELRSSYVEISKRVNTLWKSGVKNKLSLAEAINDARVNLGLCEAHDLKDGTDVYTKFLSDLPFGKSTADKFVRIGKAKWLWEVDPSNLPNDYNTLEALSTEKVSGNNVVVEYMKENLTASVGRDDISGMVDKAIAEDARGRYEPNPDTDVTISGAPSNDNKGEDGSGETPKVESKAIMTIKVSKETLEKGIGSNRDTLMGFVNTLNKVIKTVEKMDGNFILDTEASDKVVTGLLKKIESKESKARSKAFEDVSIRNLKIAS